MLLNEFLPKKPVKEATGLGGIKLPADLDIGLGTTDSADLRGGRTLYKIPDDYNPQDRPTGGFRKKHPADFYNKLDVYPELKTWHDSLTQNQLYKLGLRGLRKAVLDYKTGINYDDQNWWLGRSAKQQTDGPFGTDVVPHKPKGAQDNVPFGRSAHPFRTPKTADDPSGTVADVVPGTPGTSTSDYYPPNDDPRRFGDDEQYAGMGDIKSKDNEFATAHPGQALGHNYPPAWNPVPDTEGNLVGAGEVEQANKILPTGQDDTVGEKDQGRTNQEQIDRWMTDIEDQKITWAEWEKNAAEDAKLQLQDHMDEFNARRIAAEIAARESALLKKQNASLNKIADDKLIKIGRDLAIKNAIAEFKAGQKDIDPEGSMDDPDRFTGTQGKGGVSQQANIAAARKDHAEKIANDKAYQIMIDKGNPDTLARRQARLFALQQRASNEFGNLEHLSDTEWKKQQKIIAQNVAADASLIRKAEKWAAQEKARIAAIPSSKEVDTFSTIEKAEADTFVRNAVASAVTAIKNSPDYSDDDTGDFDYVKDEVIVDVTNQAIAAKNAFMKVEDDKRAAAYAAYIKAQQAMIEYGMSLEMASRQARIIALNLAAVKSLSATEHAAELQNNIDKAIAEFKRGSFDYDPEGSMDDPDRFTGTQGQGGVSQQGVFTMPGAPGYQHDDSGAEDTPGTQGKGGISMNVEDYGIPMNLRPAAQNILIQMETGNLSQADLQAALDIWVASKQSTASAGAGQIEYEAGDESDNLPAGSIGQDKIDVDSIFQQSPIPGTYRQNTPAGTPGILDGTAPEKPGSDTSNEIDILKKNAGIGTGRGDTVEKPGYRENWETWQSQAADAGKDINEWVKDADDFVAMPWLHLDFQPKNKVMIPQLKDSVNPIKVHEFNQMLPRYISNLGPADKKRLADHYEGRSESWWGNYGDSITIAGLIGALIIAGIAVGPGAAAAILGLGATAGTAMSR